MTLERLIVECLRGQIDMLKSLGDLVDREQRVGLRDRIESHQRLIVEYLERAA